MPNFLNLCMFLVLLFEPHAGQKRQTHVGVSEASCQVSGNPPRFTSFDGKTFGFHKPGTYILAKTSGDDTNQPGFNIKMNNQKQGDTNTMNVTLEVMRPSQKSVINLVMNNNKLEQFDIQQLGKGGSPYKIMGKVIIQTDFVITVTFDYDFLIELNVSETFKQKVDNDNQLLGELGLIPTFKPSMFFRTDFGLSLTYDGDFSMNVNVPNTFKQKMSGMCGNYNGNMADDLETPAGTQAASLADFWKSWAMNDGKSND